jgi:choline dehydrogenase-like flavoprotein
LGRLLFIHFAHVLGLFLLGGPFDAGDCAAAQVQVETPEDNPDDLADWFERQSNSGSLVEYLTTFDLTCAVAQTAPALERIARESVLDRNCRSHDVDNLYVVDSAFFPSSGAQNPALTIAANALRVAETIPA